MYNKYNKNHRQHLFILDYAVHVPVPARRPRIVATLARPRLQCDSSAHVLLRLCRQRCALSDVFLCESRVAEREEGGDRRLFRGLFQMKTVQFPLFRHDPLTGSHQLTPL